ncbi:MAG: hypothetical protein QF561_04540 [Phycisphaerales bacterium]|nr:hypothetical protein [Phycisphaerales bacterium]
MGSDGGYGERAWSAGLSERERQALRDVDLGHPNVRTLELGSVMLFGRPLPAGRIAVTACVAGPNDEAGRRTVEFRSIVMARADWTCRARHDPPQLLDAALWEDPSFEQGRTLNVSPGTVDEADPCSDARLLAAAVRLGVGPIHLVHGPQTHAAMLGMLSALSDHEAGNLRWGLRLNRPSADLDVATLDPAAPTGGVSRTTLKALRHIVDEAREEAALHASGADAAASGSDLPRGGRGLRVASGVLIALAVVLTGWLISARWQDAPVPPPTDPPAPHLPTTVPSPPVTSRTSPKPHPPRPPADPQPPPDPVPAAPPNSSTPSEQEAPPTPDPAVPTPAPPEIPSDPRVVADAIGAFNRDAFDWCEHAAMGTLTRSVRRHCIDAAITEFYDSTSGWTAQLGDSYQMPDELSLCTLLERAQRADALFEWMGGGTTPPWADLDETMEWLRDIPERPQSVWLGQVNDRITALQDCQRKLATFTKFLAAVQTPWRHAPQAPCSLETAARELASYQAPCAPEAVALIADPPGTRWPLRDLPLNSVAKSWTFLQQQRDAVTNPRE